MRLVCQIGLVICALPLLTGADIYRWVDETGVVNYTQIAPEGVPAERVSADTGQRIGPVSSQSPENSDAQESASGGSNLSDSQQSMLAELQAAEKARQAEVVRIKESNCQRARSVLERLSVRGRIRIRGDDGVERMMPEEERQQRIAEAQRGIAANCTDTANR